MFFIVALLILWAVPVDAQTLESRCVTLARVLGSDMLNCWDFEKPADADLADPGRPGAHSSPYIKIDTTMAASGRASLKFEVESYQTARARCPNCTESQIIWRAIQSGTQWWSRNIKADWSRQFGEGDGTLWMQMRFRENEAFYHNWGGDGPKKWILGVGDRWVDFRSSLCFDLPANANPGTYFKLCGGDGTLLMPNSGSLFVGAELIEYQGKDNTQNMLKIRTRGKSGTARVDHLAGTATWLHHAQYAVGCTDLDFPITHGWDRVVQPYHSCGVKDLQYEGFRLPIILSGTLTADWIYQSGRRGTWNDTTKRWEGYCSYNKIKAGNFDGCVRDEPNKWVTYTAQLDIKSYYHNDKQYRHDSTVRMWRDRELIVEHDPALRHPRSDAIPQERCQNADQTKTVAQWPANRSLMNAQDCLGGYDTARGLIYRPASSLTGPMTVSDVGGRVGLLYVGVMSWHRKEQLLENPNQQPVCCHALVERWVDDIVFATAPIPLPDGTILK